MRFNLFSVELLETLNVNNKKIPFHTGRNAEKCWFWLLQWVKWERALTMVKYWSFDCSIQLMANQHSNKENIDNLPFHANWWILTVCYFFHGKIWIHIQIIVNLAADLYSHFVCKVFFSAIKLSWLSSRISRAWRRSSSCGLVWTKYSVQFHKQCNK